MPDSGYDDGRNVGTAPVDRRDVDGGGGRVDVRAHGPVHGSRGDGGRGGRAGGRAAGGRGRAGCAPRVGGDPPGRAAAAALGGGRPRAGASAGDRERHDRGGRRDLRLGDV